MFGFLLKCIRRSEVQLSLYAFAVLKGELETALSLLLFFLMEMPFVDQLKIADKIL